MLHRFETFQSLNEKKADKLSLDEVVTEVEKQFGKKPSIEDVAGYVYDKYDLVTGLKKSNRNDEGLFPDSIEKIINHYGFDYDDFSQAYSEAAEGR